MSRRPRFGPYWIVTLVAAAVLGCAGAAAGQPVAQEIHREWEVTGFGGASLIGDFALPTPVTGSETETSRTVDLHYSSGYVVGLRLHQNLGNFWGAGLEYSFANHPFRIENLSPGLDSLPLSQSVHHFSYDVSFFLRPRSRRIRPYLSVGAGTALYFLHEASKEDARALGIELEDSWKFSVGLGGGFKYLLADHAAVTFDIKDRISGIPSYGFPSRARLEGGVYFPGIDREGLLHNWKLNLGISYQWDDYW